MNGRGARRVYLDWNASAPLRPEARAAMLGAMEAAGNPSSVHAEGRAARAILDRAREQVAALVDADPAGVVFTSGATEAAAVLGLLPGGAEVAPGAHDCLRAWHREGGAALAQGLACGETGLLRAPPAAAGRTLLLDVAQAAGRVPFSFRASGADFAILSAHKLGGPKGVGALLVRDGAEAPALLRGGGQEGGRRAGTENVIGIAGFGAAAAAAGRDLAAGLWAGVARLRDALEAALAAAAPDLAVVGRGQARLPNTSCLVLAGWAGAMQVIAMDLAGFAVSAGSACSASRAARPSRVLGELGLGPEAAASAIRVSLGWTTTEDEVAAFAAAWTDAYRRRAARAA